MTIKINEQDIKRWVANGLKAQLNLDVKPDDFSLCLGIEESKNAKGRVVRRRPVCYGISIWILPR